MHIDDLTADPLLAAITIMGSGRLGPTLAALIGLAGTVVGGLALARAGRTGRPAPDGDTTRGWRSPTAALALGATSTAFGALFLAAADGGPGTGNGVVGSVAAIVLGAVALVLGRRARSRGPAAAATSSGPGAPDRPRRGAAARR